MNGIRIRKIISNESKDLNSELSEYIKNLLNQDKLLEAARKYTILEMVENTISNLTKRIDSNENTLEKIKSADVVLLIFDEKYRQQIDNFNHESLPGAFCVVEFNNICQHSKHVVILVKTNKDRVFFPEGLQYSDC